MSEEVKRPDLLIHALKGAIPGVVVPITKIEEATRLVEYIESLEAKLKIAEEALVFYALDANYTEWVEINGGELAHVIDLVGPRKAQQALAKIQGEG